ARPEPGGRPAVTPLLGDRAGARVRPQAVPRGGVRPQSRVVRGDRRRLRAFPGRVHSAARPARPDWVHPVTARPPYKAPGVTHIFMAAGWTDTALFQPAGAQRVFPLALCPSPRAHRRGKRHAVEELERGDGDAAEAGSAGILRAP